jgi:hypothetical protein
MIGNLQHLKPEENSSLDELAEGCRLIGFDWRYLYANASVLKQLNCTKKELLGFSLMEKQPGIEATDLFVILKKCMNSREARCVENEFELPDRSAHWFEWRIHPVPEGLFILTIDITDRKTAEKEKREYIAGLEHMLHVTSHKLGQPVTQIVSVSNMLEHSLNSTEQLQKITGRLKESAIGLDIFRRELDEFIQSMEQKGKRK